MHRYAAVGSAVVRDEFAFPPRTAIDSVAHLIVASFTGIQLMSAVCVRYAPPHRPGLKDHRYVAQPGEACAGRPRCLATMRVAVNRRVGK
jgi:hypothetical protein